MTFDPYAASRAVTPPTPRHRGRVACWLRLRRHAWSGVWLDGTLVQRDGYGYGCVECGAVQG